jgi:hypothetical protein
VRNGLEIGSFGQQNGGRVIENGRHLLFGPKGSTAAYTAYLQENLPPAVHQDLERIVSQQEKVVQRQDSVIAAFAQLRKNPENANHALRKLYENEESQTALEALNGWISLNLDEPVR